MTGRRLIIDRTTIGHFGGSSRVPPRCLYAQMFVEDVGLFIVPYRLRGEDDLEHSVELSDDTRPNRRVVTRIFSEGNRQLSYDEFGRSVCEFIRGAARHLATEGRAYYEIGTLREEEPLDEAESSIDEHDPIPLPLYIPGKVFRLPGRLIQMIPSPPGRERRAFASLPLARLMQIDLPSALCSRRSLRLLHAQMLTGENDMPNYVVQKALTSLNLYDLPRYYMEGNAIRQRALGSWGSPDRFLWSVETTDYYAVYRALRFARSMAFLRQHILTSMNALLKRMGFPISVKMPTAPSIAEIESALTKLEMGQISFDDARKLTH